MGCSRCGANKSRNITRPSVISGGSPSRIVPTPNENRVPRGQTQDPKTVITGLKYVPGN